MECIFSKRGACFLAFVVVYKNSFQCPDACYTAFCSASQVAITGDKLGDDIHQKNSTTCWK
jgi:hypothetical protein